MSFVSKLKRGQNYVVQCQLGKPTKNIGKAHVYNWGNDDNSLCFDDLEYNWGTLDKYFQYIPVKLKKIT